jgi:hypothetical protein
VQPLTGAPAPARLPSAQFPPGHRKIVFKWEYHDRLYSGRGEGAARIAPPDSLALDFFLDGGVGAGYATVLGDSVFTPDNGEARRYLPPVPLLWAALGRLAIPPAPDTVARVDGSVLRADIGHEPTWRVSFESNRLARVERIAGGHILEWVNRGSNDDVRFKNERAGRTLDLRITRNDGVEPFDPTIWRR